MYQLFLLVIALSGVGFCALLFGRILRRLGAVLIVLSLGMIGMIVWRSEGRAALFDRISLGTTKAEIERRLGAPSQVTDCSVTFGGYKRGDEERAATGCETEYWYYAIWAPEALSFTFDREGRLIDKYHWVSP